MKQRLSKAIRDGHKCWKTFQLVLIRQYPRFPFDASQNIKMRMIHGELRKNYLEALPELWATTDSNLTVAVCAESELLEEKEKRFSLMKKGYHPGRRLLGSCSVNLILPRIESPGAGSKAVLQDRVYFLGGRPLIFWRIGDTMGLKLCPPDIGRFHRYLMLDIYRWKSAEELQAFVLYPYLDEEYTFWSSNSDHPMSIFSRTHWDQGRPEPRTYHGSSSWIQRHKGGKAPFCPHKDGMCDIYANYLNTFEDIDVARRFLRRFTD